MSHIKKYYRSLSILVLIFGGFFVWQAVCYETPNQTLTVAFLNIGQGDAIYIESPTHRQMIIDGGPDATLISEIGKLMPWYDHSIDVIMNTNPDTDHYSGFIDLMQRYKVGEVIEAGSNSPTPTYQRFENEIKDKNIPKVFAKRGMVINLGGGVYFKVLFPDQDVSTWTTNDGSIVGQLAYGSTTVMFTGDAPTKTLEYVVSRDGLKLKSDIMKVAHHGSKNSASELFYKIVAPTYAVISAGKKNRYGHPNQEILDLLNKFSIKTYITFQVGTVVAKSDGQKFIFNN